MNDIAMCITTSTIKTIGIRDGVEDKKHLEKVIKIFCLLGETASYI